MQFVEVNTYWIQISNVNVRYNQNNKLAHSNLSQEYVLVTKAVGN